MLFKVFRERWNQISIKHDVIYFIILVLELKIVNNYVINF